MKIKEVRGYKIQKIIGKGGNGIVYECVKDQRHYAIKIVTNKSAKPDSIERFNRE